MRVVAQVYGQRQNLRTQPLEAFFRVLPGPACQGEAAGASVRLDQGNRSGGDRFHTELPDAALAVAQMVLGLSKEGAMDDLVREINRMMLQLLVTITCGRGQSCDRKQSHDLEHFAENAANSLNARYPGNPNTKSHIVETYPCAWCFNWHVGRLMTRRRLYFLSAGVRQQRGEWGNGSS
jgi:hypothetical protein